MRLRPGATAGLARQLALPQGWRGRVVVAVLNRRNHALVTAAVAAVQPGPGGAGGAVADVGFGGALGLGLLLREAGPERQVVGVEISETMLRGAARRFRADVAAGRLQLSAGSLTELPLPTGSLAGVVTVNTLYFVEDLGRACAELARVTTGSGRVAVGLGDPDVMARMSVTRHGFRLRPVEEVADHLRRAGLAVGHRRVGRGPDAGHLLVATPAAGTPPPPAEELS